MRLIDADAIHKFVEDKVAEGKDGWADGVGYEWAWTLTAVDMQPTIDPIRAAGGCRCGECMYWDDDGRCEPPENGLIREYTKPTDFCSYGEPREAQEDG